MMLNQVKLNQVVEAAKAKAADSPSWLRAIEKAHTHLIENPYISETGDGLLILSTSGKTYHANGSCGCEAHRRGMACWHRAAAKLVRRYRETEAATPAVSEPGWFTKHKALVERQMRERMMREITAAWSQRYSDIQISAGLMARFGTNSLLALSTPIIEQIHHQVCLRSCT